MTFLRVGTHLINLDRVMTVNLNAPLVRRHGNTTGVQFNFGGMDLEVFHSEEAEALRTFFLGRANGRSCSCNSPTVEMVELATVVETVEVA